mmetsp:Transcript_12683/g.26272  ORF Transcript_12683/g.26272 Transcript_12683/m.26272 type:complete len:228 (+) Transcript_12683:472-1155(+)
MGTSGGALIRTTTEMGTPMIFSMQVAMELLVSVPFAPETLKMMGTRRTHMPTETATESMPALEACAFPMRFPILLVATTEHFDWNPSKELLALVRISLNPCPAWTLPPIASKVWGVRQFTTVENHPVPTPGPTATMCGRMTMEREEITLKKMKLTVCHRFPTHWTYSSTVHHVLFVSTQACALIPMERCRSTWIIFIVVLEWWSSTMLPIVGEFEPPLHLFFVLVAC